MKAAGPTVKTKADTSALPPRLATLRGRRAAVLLYSDFPNDTRPYRAAEAMVAAGMQVDLLCITRGFDAPLRETVDGVSVFRLPIRHRRSGKVAYLVNYLKFFVRAFLFLARRGLGGRYDVVHVHNMPDFLVFAAAIPKLRGAGVLLDMHDPMPELMTTIYDLNPGSAPTRLLHLLERMSFWYSDRIITPNIAFRDLFASRSCRAEKVKIVLNSPEGNVFDPELFPATAPDPAEFRVMHHGLIAHRHGVDQLVEAIAILRPKIPGLRLDLYGEATPFFHEVEALARKLGVLDIFHHHGELSKEAIAAEIPKCDVGIVSNRRSVFTEINFPTRIFEYLAMNRPVVAPSTQGIRDYFQADEIVLFTPGSATDMAEKILWVREHPGEAAEVLARGQAVYRHYLWADERVGFLDLVASVAKDGGRS